MRQLSTEDWIGVDFDRTLATYPDQNDYSISITPRLGMPVEAMVWRVKHWVAKGLKVKIVTARVAHSQPDRLAQMQAIGYWCEKYLGFTLPVVSEKDYRMVELWDDAAVAVERNTGRRLSPSVFEDDPEIDYDLPESEPGGEA